MQFTNVNVLAVLINIYNTTPFHGFVCLKVQISFGICHLLLIRDTFWFSNHTDDHKWQKRIEIQRMYIYYIFLNHILLIFFLFFKDETVLNNILIFINPTVYFIFCLSSFTYHPIFLFCIYFPPFFCLFSDLSLCNSVFE